MLVLGLELVTWSEDVNEDDLAGGAETLDIGVGSLEKSLLILGSRGGWGDSLLMTFDGGGRSS